MQTYSKNDNSIRQNYKPLKCIKKILVATAFAG